MNSDQIKRTPIERLYSLLAILIGAILLYTLLGQFIMINTKMPPQTIVYVDERTQIYYAPPYILGNKYPPSLDVSNLKGITAAEAEKNNYKPDSKCVEMGYFREQVTLNDKTRIKLGLIEPAPSRWNADGSWNW